MQLILLNKQKIAENINSLRAEGRGNKEIVEGVYDVMTSTLEYLDLDENRVELS